MLGIPWIDHDIVDHDFRITYTFPGLAQIGRLPKTFRSSGIYDVFVGRILFKHAGAAGRKRDTLNLRKEVAGSLTLINARTGAREDHSGILVVDNHRKNVRIVDH